MMRMSNTRKIQKIQQLNDEHRAPKQFMAYNWKTYKQLETPNLKCNLEARSARQTSETFIVFVFHL